MAESSMLREIKATAARDTFWKKLKSKRAVKESGSKKK